MPAAVQPRSGDRISSYEWLSFGGKVIGVSDRQAREYVKELERAGLIAIEQRGLRRTNLYLFIWTAELERLRNSVPEDPDHPDDTDGGASASSIPDRNSPSGPIGINSGGITSLESISSSAAAGKSSVEPKTTMTAHNQHADCENRVLMNGDLQRRHVSETILNWARSRRLKRLKADRRPGLPDKVNLDEWAEILDDMGVSEHNQIFALMDNARGLADRGGQWLNWSFLTLQVQLAAERMNAIRPLPPEDSTFASTIAEEDPTSDWAKLKANLRTQVAEIPFMNWFHATRQVGRCGSEIIIAVPDESTRAYLEDEYRELIDGAITGTDIGAVRLVVSQSGLDC